MILGDTPTYKVYVSDIGPQGIQGPEGPPGSVTLEGFPTDHEYVAIADGAQEFTTENPVFAQGYKLFVNGLRQSRSAYTVSGTTVELPDSLNILTNDLIIFEYYY
jgi:hypothetical protein